MYGVLRACVTCLRAACGCSVLQPAHLQTAAPELPLPSIPPPQISFPEKRLAMLTANVGNFSEPGDEECPNRVFFDRSQGFTSQVSHSMPLVVPCNRERAAQEGPPRNPLPGWGC